MHLEQNDLFNIWEEYYPKVYGYFLRRVENRMDVEDLTSITLTGFLQKIQQDEKSIENKHAFLWRIAHNQLCLFIKSKSKNPIAINIESENLPDVEDSGAENQRSKSFQDRLDSLQKCIQKTISGEDYIIVCEIILADKKSPEVAQKLNLQPATVRQRFSRGLKKIREKCKAIWLE